MIRVLVGLLMVAACEGQPKTPPPAPPPPAHAKAPPPADASIDARSLPAVDDTCVNDGDCLITSDELVDDPPRSYACCPGCKEVAVNAASLKKFTDACATNEPPMCPPLGCKMPVVNAKCEGGRCVAK